MAADGLYEKALAAVGAGRVVAEAAKVRASASAVLWRRPPGAQSGGSEIEVYWMRRAPEQPFMGGWHAFPGGGVGRRDAALPVAGEPGGVADGPADAGMPELVTRGAGELGPVLAEGLVGGLCRELFEEIGVVPLAGHGPLAVAAPGDGSAGSSGTRAELTRRLARGREEVEGGESFGALLAGLGLELDAGRLVYAGRWLTPPLGPVRFDNRFFLLDWPLEAGEPRVDGREVVEGEWLRPAEAIERWRRGEVITAPPILHILKVLAEDGVEAGLGRLREPLEANLGPHRRIEFRPGVLLFPQRTPTLPPAAHTNAYVLGHGEMVLIDPGSPFEEEIDGLAAALAALAGQGRRLTAIWLTHHHPDHVGGVEALRRALDVPVLAHAETGARLAARGLAIDGELAGGDRIELAGEPPMEIEVVHTPGHARGHLAFFERGLGSLVAGDLVAGFGTIVVDPPEGDMDRYLESLARLKELAPRTLFPAHGPTILDAEGKLDEYLRHRLWREERILAAWGRGLREPAAMLPEVYDDVPRQAWPLAERQILAHLERLRRAGRLD